MAITAYIEEDAMAYELVREDPRAFVQLLLEIQKEWVNTSQDVAEQLAAQIFDHEEKARLTEILTHLANAVGEAAI
jgi:hypothetical protein